MIELVIRELRVGEVGEGHVLLLQDRAGQRVVAVWISSVAAADHMQAVNPEADADPAHPTRIDLIHELLSVLDATIQEVRITGETDGVFDCEVVVNDNVVACRLSDGVAVAARAGVPVMIEAGLLDRVGLQWDAAIDNVAPAWNDHYSTMKSFREFLEGVDPGDFQP